MQSEREGSLSGEKLLFATRVAPLTRAILVLQGNLPLRALARAVYVLGTLFLFISALEFIKAGSGGVSGLLRAASADGTLNILGFGWLGAYLGMSGSPVAAIAVSLFAGGALSDKEAFSMLSGSRMGASFIVLFVGFLYFVGKRKQNDGLFIGILALLTTFTITLPAVPLGSLILDRGWFDGVQVSTPGFIVDSKDYLFGPALGAAEHLPGLLVFMVGAALLLTSFAAFDRALPDLEKPGPKMMRLKDRLERPLAMFLLGFVLTALTMSVSISLTLLIPLSLKGYVRKNNVIPFVMGANISTWADTLAAALLLESPKAVTIVFTQAVTGATVSLVLLLFLYRPYSRAILYLTNAACQNKGQFAIFLGAIFLAPMILLLV